MKTDDQLVINNKTQTSFTVTTSSGKVFKIVDCSRFIINNQLIIRLHKEKKNKKNEKKFRSVVYKFLSFSFILSGFLYTVNSTYLSFEFHYYPYFNYLLHFYLLRKFLINILIYDTEDGPHMWPKRLPSLFCVFIIDFNRNFNRDFNRRK